MTRQEAIELAFKIKENPNETWDFSSLLYSAVGLIKRETDTGATMAAKLLVDAIKGASDNLSDFCKRRIQIIEKAHIENACKSLERLSKAIEIADINAEIQMLRRQGIVVTDTSGSMGW